MQNREFYISFLVFLSLFVGQLLAREIKVLPVTGKEIHKLIQEKNSKVAIINFWASWCQPCVEEFPRFIKLYKRFGAEKISLVFVSFDAETELSRVQEFLKSQEVEFQTYLKKQKDLEFILEFDKDWSGILPSTFLFDQKGSLRARLEGEVSYKHLKREVKKLF